MAQRHDPAHKSDLSNVTTKKKKHRQSPEHILFPVKQHQRLSPVTDRRNQEREEERREEEEEEGSQRGQDAGLGESLKG